LTIPLKRERSQRVSRQLLSCQSSISSYSLIHVRSHKILPNAARAARQQPPSGHAGNLLERKEEPHQRDDGERQEHAVQRDERRQANEGRDEVQETPIRPLSVARELDTVAGKRVSDLAQYLTAHVAVSALRSDWDAACVRELDHRQFR
jgi:hypothetical protein